MGYGNQRTIQQYEVDFGVLKILNGIPRNPLLQWNII